MKPWLRVRLGEVLRLDLERVSVDAATSYPMVGVFSFGRGLFDREPIENGKTSYKYFYRLKADHVVMSQLFGWEGALTLSSEKFAGKFVSPQFPTFACNSDRLDRYFLGLAIRRQAFWDALGTRASGMGDRRRTLNPEALFACEIPLPPLQEQQRIVARIEELSSLINKARTLRQQSVKQADAIMSSSWSAHSNSETSRKFSIADLIGDSGLRNGRSVKSTGEESQIRCLALSAMRNGLIDIHDSKPVIMPLKEAALFQVQKGDVYIVRGNGSKDLCGRAGLVTEDTCGLIFPDLFIRISLPTDQILPEFFVAVWNSSTIRSVIEEKAKTTSGIWKINQGHILSTHIPVPPLLEQHLIVAELQALQTEMDAIRTLQSKTAEELDALLPAILDRAFKGELI